MAKDKKKKFESEVGRAAIVRELDESLDKAYGGTFKETMWVIAHQIRLLIGAHQSAVSYLPDANFEKAIHTHSFSKKYEKYNTYDVMPTGKGIWGVVVESNKPIRLTEKEFYSHPRFKHFSDLKDARGLEHPPIPGWLAVPVKRLKGDFVGVLQLSDKFEGDFTEEDEKKLENFSRVVGMAFDLYYTNNELAGRVKELQDFNEMTVGRELKMVELKKQVNQLSKRLGEADPYPDAK